MVTAIGRMVTQCDSSYTRLGFDEAYSTAGTVPAPVNRSRFAHVHSEKLNSLGANRPPSHEASAFMDDQQSEDTPRNNGSVSQPVEFPFQLLHTLLRVIRLRRDRWRQNIQLQWRTSLEVLRMLLRGIVGREAYMQSAAVQPINAEGKANKKQWIKCSGQNRVNALQTARPNHTGAGKVREGSGSYIQLHLDLHRLHLVEKGLLHHSNGIAGTIHGIVKTDAPGTPRRLQSFSDVVNDKVRFDALQLAEQGGMVIPIEPANELVYAREAGAEGILQRAGIVAVFAKHIPQQSLLHCRAGHDDVSAALVATAYSD